VLEEIENRTQALFRAGPAVYSNRPCELRSEMVRTVRGMSLIVEPYCAGSILMVRSQVSTLWGQVVTGSSLRRRP